MRTEVIHCDSCGHPFGEKDNADGYSYSGSMEVERDNYVNLNIVSLKVQAVGEHHHVDLCLKCTNAILGSAINQAKIRVPHFDKKP